MRLVKTLPILLSLGAALGSVSAWALPNDSQQPIHISADDAQLDDRNGIATYKGDVIITQGSMKVTGNTVTMTRAQNGDIDVVTSVGNLAYIKATAPPYPRAEARAGVQGGGCGGMMVLFPSSQRKLGPRSSHAALRSSRPQLPLG